MRKTVLTFCGILLLSCCVNATSASNSIISNPNNTAVVDEPEDEVVDEESVWEDDDDDESPTLGLNAIRFTGWGEKEWLDNEYIRTLRQYFTDVADGKCVDYELEAYKPLFKSRFVIGNIEPYIFGGTFIQIVFADDPTKLFSAWVYSDVDETTQTVTDYQVRSCRLSSDEFPLTTEKLLNDLKEHPEFKLW